GSTSYIYDTSAGSGTYAYIVDTGIITSHNGFNWAANDIISKSYSNYGTVLDIFAPGTSVLSS
uniref:Alkaline proteinase (Fragments) n=1 Tax=Fusarium culmorum TaxID=5516 RepID=ALP_FUSCU|nr:RecName: Full=Alkaline proteinase; Short=ALP [Fusarium culmorum]